MKVLLINGSPHEKGCTYTALSLIAGELNAAQRRTLPLLRGQAAPGGCGAAQRPRGRRAEF